MKIISLVENTTHSDLKAKHGLSLYIETKKHKILFDLGPNHTLFENARKKNIDLSQVDIVIISHGHRDHGGALKDFLNVNSSAKIYIQKKAFEAHYSKTLFIKIPVGLDQSLKEHKQIQLLDGDYKIDDELSLFTVSQVDQLRSSVNDVLYDENGKDTFAHEQNLIISGNKKVLVMGCGHAGIVNILNKVQAYQLDYCIGGFHLYNPLNRNGECQKISYFYFYGAAVLRCRISDLYVWQWMSVALCCFLWLPAVLYCLLRLSAGCLWSGDLLARVCAGAALTRAQVYPVNPAESETAVCLVVCFCFP